MSHNRWMVQYLDELSVGIWRWGDGLDVSEWYQFTDGVAELAVGGDHQARAADVRVDDVGGLGGRGRVRDIAGGLLGEVGELAVKGGGL